MNRKALSLCASLLSLIAINSAGAQTARKVTLEASIPFEFVVGNRAFPAGHYVFELATGSPKGTDQSAVLIVRGHERRYFAAVATGVTTDENAHVQPKVMFVRSGDRMLLSKVWRQGDHAGLTLRTAPGVTEEQESEVFTLDAQAVTGGV
ncbi:MAG TPA: hypothetical protein VFL34_15075 [Candidatus Sulfotelmatobacter sp.]|nr:hypothetical protein [Candidatus Sulfotelmatobacter sp.]